MASAHSAEDEAVTVRFRRASPADRDAILQLRRDSFPHSDREKQDARFWGWEFAQSDPSSAIFVAEDDSRVLAHIAFVSEIFVIGGSSRRAALAVDAMTAPEARGRHFFSNLVGHAVEEMRADHDFLTAYQIRDQVLGPMLRAGFRVADRLRVYARPLSPRAVIASALPIEKLPDPSGVSILDGMDAPAMARCAEVMFGRRSHQPRSTRFIEWRYFERPLTSYRVTGVTADGEIIAWLAARRTLLRGRDTAAIVDLVCRPDTLAAASRLVSELTESARKGGATLAGILLSKAHPLHPLLFRKLFLPTPFRFQLLVHPLRTRPSELQEFVLSWGDTDHL